MSMEQGNSHTDDATRLDLVCHYQFENGSSQFLFLDLSDGNGAAMVKHSLSFFSESFVQILASSNGFLLLSAHHEVQLCYYIFHPLTKNYTIIPQPCINHIVRVGLASDDGCHFQAVLVAAASSSSSSSNPNHLELFIFSSDTGKWRKHPHPINLALDSLPELEFQELKTPPLYSNGAIHWEIAGYLLVYHVKTSHYELHQLPNFFEDWSWQSTMTYRRTLCESRGRVYYCYTDFDGFHIWGLLKLKEHDHHMFSSCDDPQKLSWRLVHSVKHEIFTLRLQNLFGNWEPNRITPIAYNAHDHAMFLQLPGGVVSYNLDTENLRSVCSYSYAGLYFNCCLFLPFVASGMYNMQREGEVPGNREIELNLPLAEAEVETFSF